MTRFASTLVIMAALLALLLAAGCSEDDENDPPRVVIVSPDDGHHFTSAATLVEVEVDDDSGVPLVELRLDGEVVASLRDTLKSLLPVGLWADGLEHELRARAHDTDDATGDSGVRTITIDPALQTVPQITSVAPDAGAAGQLVATWLAFPEALGYTYEVARTDGFADLLASGDTSELSLDLALNDASLAYVRVRAMVAEGLTSWSRTFRYDGTAGWRQRYELAGPQQGTAILTAADGSLYLLSHAVRDARIDRAAVELLRVSNVGEPGGVRELLDDTHLPTSHLLLDDGSLLIGGISDSGYFLASFRLSGEMDWYYGTTLFEPTALLREADGTVRLLGNEGPVDYSQGVSAVVTPSTGVLSDMVTFDLDTGARVLAAWPHEDGGWVVAGQLADVDTQHYGGVFADHIAADGQTMWRLRLGSADRWLMRGQATNGSDQFCLGGIAYKENKGNRYGFIVNFDDDGSLRWQLGETDWHFYSDLVSLPDGRWTAVGAHRRSVDSDNWLYDTALRGISEGGLPLWEIQHESGRESQGWDLAPHPDGGWYVLGFMTPDSGEYDLDLLRVDDRGELD